MNIAVHLVEDEVEDMSLEHPIVIVGTGPVGIKTLTTLLAESPDKNIIVYGDEPWEPYNRVKLSSFLAGEIDWADLTDSQKIPEIKNLVQHQNCKITKIDKDKKVVIDELGREQKYEKLILALGSRPHIPGIEGVELDGVYTFRDMTDTNRLLARQTKSRTTVIVGGGVLGLEAGKAMLKNNTNVVVVDHAMRLMSNQLDEDASELVKEHIYSLGIRLSLGSGIKKVLGENKVTGIELLNGKKIDCDTVIFSTGIKPNIELARDAKISIGKGVRVSDTMLTSDPDIYAVGECAEHRNIVYGLVAPGFEQAKVAVADIFGKKTNYTGSIMATQLKVVGMPVFSMGRTGEGESKSIFVQYIYSKPEKGLYRKIIIFRNRVVGAISVGNWDTLHRVQESITKNRYIWPWQLKRFSKMGDLWSLEQSKKVSQWPASAIVCNCMNVSRGQCSKAISTGCSSVEEIMQSTSASTVCGGCRPLISELLGGVVKAEKIKAVKSFMFYSLLTSIAMLAALFLPGLMYNPSAEVNFQWDQLWRNGLIKQVTGYSILGMTLFGLLISLAKRWKKFSFFQFSVWRYLHVLIGVFIVIALFSHTGFRLGNNLNGMLMVLFSGLILVGGIYGLFMSLQHKLDGVFVNRVRGYLNWTHLLLFWPVPVLLSFHVLKTYYF